MKGTSRIWLELPNGGMIEKNYLIKCILVAKEENNYRKVKYTEVYPDSESHAHCEICSQVIAAANDVSSIDTAFFSNETWVCPQCYSLFVVTYDFQSTISQLKTIYNPG